MTKPAPKGAAALRARIEQAPARPGTSEPVPMDDYWPGVTIEVRGLVLGARSRLMERGYTQTDPPVPVYERFYPMLLAGTCFDPETGEAVFVGADGKPDEEFVNAQDPGAVDKLAAVALRLSGLDKPSAGALGNGSGETPSGGSSSPSPGS